MESPRTQVRIEEVCPEEDGRKLLSFLEARTGSLPRPLFMRLVRTGQIRIDGKRCKPFARVLAGQQIRIPPLPQSRIPRLDEAQPTELRLNGRIDIVFQDEEILLLNKPSGLPVHPGSGWKDSVYDRLKILFAEHPFTPTPVHRLDRDTSGLLLCARTHAFLRDMHSHWDETSKAYLCWVEGEWPSPGWKKLTARLAKNRRDDGRERMTAGEGKIAVTYIHALEIRQGRSLLLVKLGTGRTHQIRVMLANCGFALTGDPKYGQGHNLHLHAAALAWGAKFFCLPPVWEQPFATDISSATLKALLADAPVKEKA